jgi:hypothetical protein
LAMVPAYMRGRMALHVKRLSFGLVGGLRRERGADKTQSSMDASCMTRATLMWDPETLAGRDPETLAGRPTGCVARSPAADG